MKKRLLTVAMTGVMAAALLAGCGSSAPAASSSEAPTAEAPAAEAEAPAEEAGEAVDLSAFPEETIKIGVVAFDTTDEQFLAMADYFDYLEDNMNIEFMYSESIENPEGEMDFIDSCASAGCKGIIAYYNVAGAESMQRAIDQGMAYWGTEQYADEFVGEDLYAGCYTFTKEGETNNGDYLGGYQLGYSLGQKGVKHVFYCNGGASFGIQMFIDRQAGFEAGIEAAQAEGCEIQYDPSADVIEGWPGTDDFTAAVGAKLAGDYDGAAVSFNAAVLFQPIADADKVGQIQVAAIGGVNDTYYDAVNSGLISTIVYDCEEVVFGNGVVQLINTITGHADVAKDAPDALGLIFVNRWTITNPDEFNAIYDFHDAGNYFITAADVANMCAEYNADVTFDQIKETYGKYDLETALSEIQ